jgi:RNA polymerase sigma-70 factor (TIGR02943 family)
MKTEKEVFPFEDRHRAQPEQWVEKYADYLFRYAATRVSDQEKARDLVQDTFLSALENVAGFEGRSSESTWLTAILKNKIIDHYRRRSTAMAKMTEPLEEITDHDFFEAGDGHWNQLNSPKEFGIENNPLVTKEFTKVLQNCMKKLPAQWFSVFTLKHMEDETSEKICTTLKISPANFWVIMHRSKLNIRACLQKNWL